MHKEILLKRILNLITRWEAEADANFDLAEEYRKSNSDQQLDEILIGEVRQHLANQLKELIADIPRD